MQENKGMFLVKWGTFCKAKCSFKATLILENVD